MLSIKNINFSIFLGIALLLSGWSTYIIYHQKRAPSTDNLGKPDAFMEEVTATIIDKEGHPHIKIVASKMIHYVENDSTDILNPWLTLYRKSPKPWQLTALHAKTIQGTDEILLWENVIINHPGDEQNQRTTLQTPTLTVYPNQQVAKTLDPIEIHQPNSVIHAVGMNADLATGAVKLLAQAQGEFNVEE